MRHLTSHVSRLTILYSPFTIAYSPPLKQHYMITIGLIREGKTPADNRVALTPAQCKWIHREDSNIRIIAQSSPARCFSDKEYTMAGVKVQEDMSACDILLGIKEVPVDMLIEGKTYLFFSHTRKEQPPQPKIAAGSNCQENNAH